MQDVALDKYIESIRFKYKDIITETEVCEILKFKRTYYYVLRAKNPIIPFLKIGNRHQYLLDDVIAYLKNSRIKIKE